ncbi:MAG: hypothetical protein VB118_05970 [Oscillospiraceae bacterium]|nr:hypothetical protein [Oscillospiraceae bacterium]
MRKAIKNIFFTMGLSFTAIVYSMSLMRNLIESKKESFLGIAQMSSILLFSFILGLCGLVFLIPKLPGFVKWTIHFVASAGAFFVCIVVLLGLNNTSSYIFISLILFTLCYLAVSGISAIIRSSERRLENKNREYNAVYVQEEQNGK